jgi:hypothetical protein
VAHGDGDIARHALAKAQRCHVHASDDARGADAGRDTAEARVDHAEQVAHLGALDRHLPGRAISRRT